MGNGSWGMGNGVEMRGRGGVCIDGWMERMYRMWFWIDQRVALRRMGWGMGALVCEGFLLGMCGLDHQMDVEKIYERVYISTR